MSRNSVRKYLSQLDAGTDDLTNKELADKAYNNEQLESNIQRKLQIILIFHTLCSSRSSPYFFISPVVIF
jgi:hypothetical protein